MKRCSALLILFLLSGCAGTTEISVVQNITKCPAPTKPSLISLDNATHVASEKNVAVLMNNLNSMKTYGDQLNATITCYESQLKDKTK